MNRRYCYWSVVDGDYALMAQAVVRSARRLGVFKDFHIWTDKPIEEAICHDAGKFEKWGCLFKLVFLRDAVQKLNYDYGGGGGWGSSPSTGGAGWGGSPGSGASPSAGGWGTNTNANATAGAWGAGGSGWGGSPARNNTGWGSPNPQTQSGWNV